MATIIKEKSAKTKAVEVSWAVSDYYKSYTFNDIINYMEEFGLINSKDKKKLEFKLEVINLMHQDGASEEYIEKYLTDNAVENAMQNGFSAEDLAWTLLH